MHSGRPVDTGCKPYWNDDCLAVSRKVWLPKQLMGSSINNRELFWNRSMINDRYVTTVCTVKPEHKSAQLSKSERQSQSSKKRKLETASSSDDIKQYLQQRAVVLRMLPDTQQQLLLRKYFGVSRFVYNKTLHWLQATQEEDIASAMASEQFPKVTGSDLDLELQEVSNPKADYKRFEYQTLSGETIVKHYKIINSKNNNIANRLFVSQKSYYRKCHSRNKFQHVRNQKFTCVFCEEINKSSTYKVVANEKIKDWEAKVPAIIRNRALAEVFKAYQSSFALLQSSFIKKFKLRFRSRKNLKQSITVPKNHIHLSSDLKSFSMFKMNPVLQNIKLSNNNHFVLRDGETALPSDVSICYDGLHWTIRYLLTISQTVDQLKKRSEENRSRGIVALDPGNFSTFSILL